MIETLWTFLIETELASSLYNYLEQKLSQDLTKAEIEFKDYVKKSADLITFDFTIRMERAIKDLVRLNTVDDKEEQRILINKALYSEFIGPLRQHLGNALQGTAKVFVLVDNLDKAWQPRNDIAPLSEFLFGLLSIAPRISKSFARHSSNLQPVDVAIVVFLRSDIFNYITRQARETDKLQRISMDWSEDGKLLQRIIEARFSDSVSDIEKAAEIWQNYFVKNIDGIATKNYILENIIPRPRDIIFLCKQAIFHAVNYDHNKIEIDDIAYAEQEYSLFAYNSMVDEVKVQFPDIEELLFQFAGAPEIITYEFIKDCVKRAKLSDDKLDYAIDLLCDATFFGLEKLPDQFEFLYRLSEKPVIKSIAERTAETMGQRRFKINFPFHRFLQVVPT